LGRPSHRGECHLCLYHRGTVDNTFRELLFIRSDLTYLTGAPLLLRKRRPP
jgi:hypothetical protein